METNLRRLLILMLCILVVGCSSKKSQSKDKKFVVSYPPRYIEDSNVLSLNIKVENTTDKPIKIGEVIRSCSCSQADIDKKELAPGEISYLIGSIQLEGKSGPNAINIGLCLEDNVRWVYEIRLNIYHREEWVPNQLRLTEPDFKTTFVSFLDKPVTFDSETIKINNVLVESFYDEVIQNWYKKYTLSCTAPKNRTDASIKSSTECILPVYIDMSDIKINPSCVILTKNSQPIKIMVRSKNVTNQKTKTNDGFSISRKDYIGFSIFEVVLTTPPTKTEDLIWLTDDISVPYTYVP